MKKIKYSENVYIFSFNQFRKDFEAKVLDWEDLVKNWL